MLVHPPLAFELELATSKTREVSPACGIGDFLEHDAHVEGTGELELPIGFTNTAFSGDWRTRAQIELGLDLHDRPPVAPRSGASS